MIDQMIELFERTTEVTTVAIITAKEDSFSDVVEAEAPRSIYTGAGVNPINVEAALQHEGVAKAAKAVAESVTGKLSGVIESMALSWAGANIRGARYGAQAQLAMIELADELSVAKSEGASRIEVLRATVRGLRRIWEPLSKSMNIHVFSKEGA